MFTCDGKTDVSMSVCVWCPSACKGKCTLNHSQCAGGAWAQSGSFVPQGLKLINLFCTEPGHTLWDTWYRMTATERGRRKTVVLHVSRRQGKRGGRFSSWASWTGSWNTVCMSRQWQSIESINTSVVVPLSLSFLFFFDRELLFLSVTCLLQDSAIMTFHR